MSKSDRTTWLVYGGVVGAVAFSVLAVLILAWLKYFVPLSTHMSWAQAPILLLLTVPCGFMLGGWIGYDIAPKTKPERAQFFKEGLFCLFIVAICQLILHSLWNKPEANGKFGVLVTLVAWDLGPIILACSLWKLLSRRRRETRN
jgi:hypothetical protein